MVGRQQVVSPPVFTICISVFRKVHWLIEKQRFWPRPRRQQVKEIPGFLDSKIALCYLIALTLPHHVSSFFCTQNTGIWKKKQVCTLEKCHVTGINGTIVLHCQENKALRVLTAHLQHRTDNTEIPFAELNWTLTMVVLYSNCCCTVNHHRGHANVSDGSVLFAESSFIFVSPHLSLGLFSLRTGGEEWISLPQKAEDSSLESGHQGPRASTAHKQMCPCP